ncbi:MAG: hypothetical protein KDK78_01090 [Chlamydiia bacterium]|nr:hypothetical protein [Chlamydiia bacterium]
MGYRRAALLSVLMLTLLAGCQYRWGNCSWTSGRPVFRVPYADGDHLGQLTSEIVSQLSRSGRAEYRDCDACYELRVCLRDCNLRNVGYRYDERGERGDLRERVIPAEARTLVNAEVTVIDLRCCEVVLGPTLVGASVEFDFDVYANHSQDNIFSLGQLNDREVSRDLVLRPLYRELAKNIVDYVLNTW